MYVENYRINSTAIIRLVGSHFNAAKVNSAALECASNYTSSHSSQPVYDGAFAKRRKAP